MALQGTLDTFELPDVLRLLASTKKTGRLHLRGSRGDGSVWVDGGRVTSLEADGTTSTDPPEVMFELLRETNGGFVFETDSVAPSPGLPRDVEPLLIEAESQLAEWRQIEAVVPSLDAWVSLSAELNAPQVTLDASTWIVIVRVGSGITAGDLGQALGLGELAVCRIVRDLVAAGFAVVTATAGYGGSAFEQDWRPETYVAPEPERAPEPMPVFEPERPVFAVDDLVASAPAPAPAAAPAPLLDPEPQLAQTVLPPMAFADADPEEADELARQLAMLSPRAAQAVAAAAAADNVAERDAALDAVEEGDEPINRGLLLKFLSSVKS